MRNTLIFAGTSCPVLAGQICENLGMHPASAELTQFSNVSRTTISQRLAELCASRLRASSSLSLRRPKTLTLEPGRNKCPYPD